MIDSRDFLAAKRRAENEVLLPAGPKVAFTGGLDFNDVGTIWERLDKVHAKHPDMVLLHGGSVKGAELIAAKWADTRKVPQIAFKPDWTKHAKAAPFKRNDQMLEVLPIGSHHFPRLGDSGQPRRQGEKTWNSRLEIWRARRVSAAKAPDPQLQRATTLPSSARPLRGISDGRLSPSSRKKSLHLIAEEIWRLFGDEMAAILRDHGGEVACLFPKGIRELRPDAVAPADRQYGHVEPSALERCRQLGVVPERPIIVEPRRHAARRRIVAGELPDRRFGDGVFLYDHARIWAAIYSRSRPFVSISGISGAM